MHREAAARCTRCPAATSRASTTSTTRSSSSTTDRIPTSGSAPTFVAGFGPEFRYSTSVTTPHRRRSPRSTAASPPRGPQPRADDRRRPRPHARRAPLRHGRPADLRPGGRRHPAVVRRSRPAAATPGRRLRPGLRGPAVRQIGWPTEGYRLFEIGHFIGDRDWFDGVWESNCLFVAARPARAGRRLRRELLDAGRRVRQPRALRAAGRSPGINVVTILGEGSFHQLHGGTTTNVAERTRWACSVRARHYAEIRGRGFRGPNKTVHFVGHHPTAVRRSGHDA